MKVVFTAFVLLLGGGFVARFLLGGLSLFVAEKGIPAVRVPSAGATRKMAERGQRDEATPAS